MADTQMAPSRPPAFNGGLTGVQRDSFADQCLERGLVDLSPSWKSMARLALPSRLELKSFFGSFICAPLKNVTFTTLLYVSPVQIIPL